MHPIVKPPVSSWGENVRQCSVYRGPLLLGYDPRFNTDASRDPPTGLMAHPLTLAALHAATLDPPGTGFAQPQVSLAVPMGSSTVRLAEYASLGLTGQTLSTWLPVALPAPIPAAPFSRADPTRTFVLPAAHGAATPEEEEGWVAVQALGWVWLDAGFVSHTRLPPQACGGAVRARLAAG